MTEYSGQFNDFITGEYDYNFGRAPSQDALGYWGGRMEGPNADLNQSNFRDALISEASDSDKAYYNSWFNPVSAADVAPNSAVVNAYPTYFGREGAADGIGYWSAKLANPKSGVTADNLYESMLAEAGADDLAWHDANYLSSGGGDISGNVVVTPGNTAPTPNTDGSTPLDVSGLVDIFQPDLYSSSDSSSQSSSSSQNSSESNNSSNSQGNSSSISGSESHGSSVSGSESQSLNVSGSQNTGRSSSSSYSGLDLDNPYVKGMLDKITSSTGNMEGQIDQYTQNASDLAESQARSTINDMMPGVLESLASRGILSGSVSDDVLGDAIARVAENAAARNYSAGMEAASMKQNIPTILGQLAALGRMSNASSTSATDGSSFGRGESFGSSFGESSNQGSSFGNSQSSSTSNSQGSSSSQGTSGSQSNSSGMSSNPLEPYQLMQSFLSSII